MNRSTGLTATAVLAAAVSGCSIVGGGSTSEINKPGPDISQAPPAPPANPPCGRAPSARVDMRFSHS